MKPTKPCIMCAAEFDEAALDYIGRCTPCFKKYMQMSDSEKPSLGVPFTPISKAVK